MISSKQWNISTALSLPGHVLPIALHPKMQVKEILKSKLYSLYYNNLTSRML